MSEEKSQGRKWQLTINNPSDHGYTKDGIIGELQTLRGRTYYCLCDERGSEGTHHFHVFIYRPSPITFEQLKNLFPTAHIVRCIGTCAENRNYVLKDGDKFNKDENGNYEYIDSKGTKHKGINYSVNFFENTECPDEVKSRATNAARVVEMVQIGASDEEIVSQVPSAYRDIEKLQRLRSLYRDEEYRRKWRDLTVTYIYGETGSGKTRGVMEQYGYENVYRVTDYSHPFDSYEGQDVLVFEEFRGNIRHGDMLNYLDGYPLLLPCRYFNRQACFTKVFITTNIPPTAQYPNIDEASQKAFFRRIHKVIHFVTSDFKIEYKSFDEYLYAQRYGKLP